MLDDKKTDDINNLTQKLNLITTNTELNNGNSGVSRTINWNEGSSKA
jgi:hypothetical protein